MRKLAVGLTSLTLALSSTAALAGPSLAAPPTGAGLQVTDSRTDELPNALEDKRRDLREQALNAVLAGEVDTEQRGVSTVVNLAEVAPDPATASAQRRAAAAVDEDQYVELARETTDRIFVVLAEFGDERHPDFPDQDTDPTTEGPAVFEGPLHNQIPEPDRSVDNSTVWQPDYDREHYEELYFSQDPGAESVAQYYERQSSGRYSVEGTVTDWVKVRYNEARYGRSDDDPDDENGDDPAVCASNVCNTTWQLVNDAVDQWVADQSAAGRTEDEIEAELATFDEWDRYDGDGDGDFNESDGYIDHFQIVHAGGDQADGDPFQGEDAIWSHRWYAFGTDFGLTGPERNPFGGAEIGETDIWVGDYTIQPENGGRSVFKHEYGHDLGLPDHYDTAGGGDNNGTGWWTLMSQSRVRAEGDVGIGTRAADLSAWDKLQLGWLDYEVALAGQDRRYVLGPHEYNTDDPQALVVVLPDKEVTTELGAPFAGENQYWSGSGDNLSNTMTRTLDLTAATTSASMSLKARYEIEEGYDYLYAEASLDGGATWTALDGTVDGEPFGRDASGTPAIDGSTGGAWVDMVIPMDVAVGRTVEFRFRYQTDSGLALPGFFADDITVTADGVTVLQDGAEDGGEGWVLDGFTTTTGTEVALFEHYYIASHRTYESYDQYLRTGPYNFGFGPEQPDRVEFFPYQDGLLVSYWDTSQSDNNTTQHPGEGLILPIDSRPEPIYNLAGEPWRGRIQVYDAPFSRDRADSFTLHVAGEPSYIRGQRGVPLFDDTRSYWNEALPFTGVKTPGVGVGLRVLRTEGTEMTVRLLPTGD